MKDEFAEFERGTIRERTMAGLATARADGRYGGRPPALSLEDVETARALLAKGEPIEKLLDRFGVARSTLYKHGLRKHPPMKQKPKRTRSKKS